MKTASSQQNAHRLPYIIAFCFCIFFSPVGMCFFVCLLLTVDREITDISTWLIQMRFGLFYSDLLSSLINFIFL